MKNTPKIFLALTLLPSSCAMHSAAYEPPSSIAETEPVWERELPLPYDAVWEALIDHAAGTFFAIENFEKESGLMTLSFGASDIGRFVDGGHWVASASQLGATPIEFDGNYATFLEQYQNAELTGSMNISVRRLSAQRTVVKVRSRYVISSVTQAASGATYRNTWSFDTGGSDTVVVQNAARGIPPQRTMQPTHAAELSILNAVETMGSQ